LLAPRQTTLVSFPAMTMIRTPFSLLCRRSVAVLSHRRPSIRLAVNLNLRGREISVRQFSDKDEKVMTFAVDQDDDDEGNTESASAPPSDMDLSKYTVHVPVRMPDMGESKGVFE
jgi:hypothetical protein